MRLERAWRPICGRFCRRDSMRSKGSGIIRRMTRVLVCFCAMGFLFSLPAWGQDKKKKEEETQRKLIQVINSQASAINGCTERYLQEYPTKKGAASINLKVDKKGADP